MAPVLNLRKEAMLWCVKTGNFIKIYFNIEYKSTEEILEKQSPIPNVMSDLSGSVSDIYKSVDYR